MVEEQHDALPVQTRVCCPGNGGGWATTMSESATHTHTVSSDKSKGAQESPTSQTAATPQARQVCESELHNVAKRRPRVGNALPGDVGMKMMMMMMGHQSERRAAAVAINMLITCVATPTPTRARGACVLDVCARQASQRAPRRRRRRQRLLSPLSTAISISGFTCRRGLVQTGLVVVVRFG